MTHELRDMRSTYCVHFVMSLCRVTCLMLISANRLISLQLIDDSCQKSSNRCLIVRPKTLPVVIAAWLKGRPHQIDPMTSCELKQTLSDRC